MWAITSAKVFSVVLFADDYLPRLSGAEIPETLFNFFFVTDLMNPSFSSNVLQKQSLHTDWRFPFISKK